MASPRRASLVNKLSRLLPRGGNTKCSFCDNVVTFLGSNDYTVAENLINVNDKMICTTDQTQTQTFCLFVCLFVYLFV